MNPCIFCRIISQEPTSARIRENELAVAFLDIRPINRGHTLVVPRRHVPSFGDLTVSESTAVFRLIQEVASALKLELPECTGITLSAADGEAAGQEVPHAHFHVIPPIFRRRFRVASIRRPRGLRSTGDNRIPHPPFPDP